MERHGPWEITDEICQYQDDHVCLTINEVVRPDGKPGRYAVVDIKAGVSVLPLDERNNVYLTRQFRFGLGRESLEVISGGMDGEEPPLKAAQRETREELGIIAGEWVDLGVIEIDTSIVRSPGFLFIARDLSLTRPEQDGTEQIVTVKMSLDEAVQKVMDGEIVHAPSAVILLKAKHLFPGSTGKQETD